MHKIDLFLSSTPPKNFSEHLCAFTWRTQRRHLAVPRDPGREKPKQGLTSSIDAWKYLCRSVFRRWIPVFWHPVSWVFHQQKRDKLTSLRIECFILTGIQNDVGSCKLLRILLSVRASKRKSEHVCAGWCLTVVLNISFCAGAVPPSLPQRYRDAAKHYNLGSRCYLLSSPDVWWAIFDRNISVANISNQNWKWWDKTIYAEIEIYNLSSEQYQK